MSLQHNKWHLVWHHTLVTAHYEGSNMCITLLYVTLHYEQPQARRAIGWIPSPVFTSLHSNASFRLKLCRLFSDSSSSLTAVELKNHCVGRSVSPGPCCTTASDCSFVPLNGQSSIMAVEWCWSWQHPRYRTYILLFLTRWRIAVDASGRIS
jgi:hypothetical protein